jgi:4-hydroxy-2-oxoheptanedioate aldolase
VRLPNTALTEAAGLHGFDFVIFDCEHGPADVSLVLEHLMICRAVGVPALVRLPGGDTDGVLRVLDAGATGLLVPRIAAAADVRATVAAASYPPRGTRGFAVYTPAGRYGLTAPAEHLTRTNDELVVIAMIEDAAGIAAAGEIAAEPGVAGTLVGPADLSVDLGHGGRTDHPDVVAGIAAVHAATREAGAAVMVITGRPAAAAAAFAGGAQLVLINLAMTVNDALAVLVAVRDEA